MNGKPKQNSLLRDHKTINKYKEDSEIEIKYDL